MKTRLGRLGANADEKDCQIISRELEDIAAKSTIPDELQERILSSAMRKVGIGMNMTMNNRKEDAHNTENLNAVKRNHTAAACIALLFTAAAGALFIFGGKSINTDDVTPTVQSEKSASQSVSQTEPADVDENIAADCPFGDYTPYPVRLMAPAYAPYLLEADADKAIELQSAVTSASWERIPTETPLPDGEAYSMFAYNSGKPLTLVFYGDNTVEYKSGTEISRYKTDDTSVFGLIAKTANPKNLGELSDTLIWCEPEDLTSEGVWKKSRVNIEFDKDKNAYYEKNSGEYLTFDDLGKYLDKLNSVAGSILHYGLDEAFEPLLAADIEYEILEPGYCPNVPVGEIYMIHDSFEDGLKIYVNRGVEGLPDVNAAETNDIVYENAGFKVLYFGTNSGYACEELALDDFCRVISEKYIKTPEQISEELLGKTDSEAEKIIGEAGFLYKRIAGERSEYDAGLIYASEYRDGMICYYVSKGNINNPWVMINVPLPEGGLKGDYQFEAEVYDTQGIYYPYEPRNKPKTVSIAGKTVSDPQDGAEIELSFEEIKPMRVTIYAERLDVDNGQPPIKYAEYDIKNGKATMVGEPDFDSLAAIDKQ